MFIVENLEAVEGYTEENKSCCHLTNKCKHLGGTFPPELCSVLLLRVTDGGGAGGPTEKDEQEKTAMYKRNLLEMLSGQGAGEMATGCQHWGGSGKWWGQWGTEGYKPHSEGAVATQLEPITTLQE